MSRIFKFYVVGNLSEIVAESEDPDFGVAAEVAHHPFAEVEVFPGSRKASLIVGADIVMTEYTEAGAELKAEVDRCGLLREYRFYIGEGRGYECFVGKLGAEREADIGTEVKTPSYVVGDIEADGGHHRNRE